ncbi:spheroidene monooxygenase [Iamia sp. SCSIO 61187]|uniref:hypothetical protein n=1 Tax=Iamia sp. SCSIO 61187 TaxID=2722752 RepID=UPI001C62C06A|nr:hypothetical protein [Iamia sp. SCSIO 61187]QYG91738.1 spheroidene monooxygenase [Iamia sp. SCSIO 61187]
MPRPTLDRVIVVATWDDDESVEGYMQQAALPEMMIGGWHVRLAPIHTTGSWPGLEPAARRGEGEHGPVAVLTLGRLRLRRSVPFFRASARAEAQILRAPGLIWATGMGRPPFVGTCSLWRDGDSVDAFAYRDQGSAHRAAMAADHRDPFHSVSAFLRLRPYLSLGRLAGANPLRADWLTSASDAEPSVRP